MSMDNLFTLADARKHKACADGYQRFEAALMVAYPDAADLDTLRWSIGDVARVNLNDALWCLRMVDDARIRVSAIMPAVKRASSHTTYARVHFCIAELDRWLAGDDSVDLQAAAAAAGASRDAARTAARAAAEAAMAAAEAAMAAKWAVMAAAWAAAWATARAAAWASRDAAGDAGAAERAQQTADLIAAFQVTFGDDDNG